MMVVADMAWHETDLYSGNGRLSYNKGGNAPLRGLDPQPSLSLIDQC